MSVFSDAANEWMLERETLQAHKHEGVCIDGGTSMDDWTYKTVGGWEIFVTGIDLGKKKTYVAFVQPIGDSTRRIEAPTEFPRRKDALEWANGEIGGAVRRAR